MDNVAYIALSRQMTLRRELDISANNLANMNTTGYKFERLLIEAEPGAPAFNDSIKTPANFAYDVGMGRDFSQGSMMQTGNPFDLAIDGEGAFFVVDGPNGPLYTRNGGFMPDATGTLRTQDGLVVQGQGGGALVIDPQKGEPVISETGIVSQFVNGTAEIVGTINVVRVGDLGALEKTGDNYYTLTSGAAAPATDAKVHQGMLEGSNVNPMFEITRLIEINRAYAQVASIIEQNHQLTKSAINTLGKVA